jgi:hypothetical protein
MDHHIAERGSYQDGCNRVPVASCQGLRLDNQLGLVGSAEEEYFVAAGLGYGVLYLEKGFFRKIAFHLMERYYLYMSAAIKKGRPLGHPFLFPDSIRT